MTASAPPRLTLYERALVSLGPALYGLVVAVILIFLILPMVIIVPVSFTASSFLIFPPTGFSLRWYQQYLQRSDWVAATLLSLQVGAMVSVVATTIGTLAALALRRRFWGKWAIQALILSPMIVPVIIFAIGIYFIFSQLRLTGTLAGLVAAHTVLALPRVVLIVSAVLKGFDARLEQAAMTLGASPARTFALVTFPIIRPGLLSAALLAFLTSFDEVIVAIFLSGTTAVTLPKRMWDGIRLEYDPTMAAASSLIMSVSVLAIVLLALLQRGRARGVRL